MIDPEKIDNMLKDDPNLLKHERTEDRLVLTASSEALQKFLLTRGRSDDLFGDPAEMTRRAPLYSKQNLIFTDTLLGRWKSDGGSTMDVARRDELTYHITRVQEDGTRVQCLANLVQVGDTRLLAVFLDESGHDSRLPDICDFIPNLFVQIGGMEPELRLRAVEYAAAARFLGKSDDESTPDDGSGAQQFEVFHRL